MKAIDLSKTLTPEDVTEELKRRRDQLRRDILKGIPCTDYLKKAKHGGYICPYCGSGTGEHKTGAVKYYKNTNTCACHACPDPGQVARKFDALDLMRKIMNCDYNTALQEGARVLGVTFPTRENVEKELKEAADGQKRPAQAPESVATPPADKTPEALPETPQTAQEAPAGADYTDYYMECMQRMDATRAIAYLQARGISLETAQAYNVGYDPAADPASAPGAPAGGNVYKPHPCPRLIIPCSKGFYVARSIDPATPKAFKAPNPKGSKPAYFNGREVKQAGPVFIVESAIDALSIIDVGGRAVGLNSTNQAGNFIKSLKQYRTDVQSEFIVCMDNDKSGKEAAETLTAGLRELNIKHITFNIAGDQNDPNDALRADRAAFTQAIKAAQDQLAAAPAPDEIPLPGLLNYADMVREFENADDDIITIKPFPEFSKTAKIKKHSTVALAADTGGGKSSLAINFMAALNPVYPCLYINLEMDTITVLRRLVAIESGLEIDQIEGYKKDPKTAEAVNVFLKAYTEKAKPLQVIEDDVYTLEAIEKVIQQSTKGRELPTMVFIDHALLVETDAAGRYDRFTIVSERLRKMSRKYNIVLFVLLQQSRAGKADEEERPKNSSLKESGSWENDATQIVFLWYDPKTQRKKLIITKNRNGDSGEFTLNYWKKTQTYTEAKDQGPGPAGTVSPAQRITKRDKARGKLQDAYSLATITTNGHPTIRAMAEAADVTTATVKRWIKEYGGCTVDGVEIDPAGIDNEVEYTGFIKLTPGDNAPIEEGAEGPESAPRTAGRRR